MNTVQKIQKAKQLVNGAFGMNPKKAIKRLQEAHTIFLMEGEGMLAKNTFQLLAEAKLKADL